MRRGRSLAESAGRGHLSPEMLSMLARGRRSRRVRERPMGRSIPRPPRSARHTSPANELERARGSPLPGGRVCFRGGLVTMVSSPQSRRAIVPLGSATPLPSPQDCVPLLPELIP
jgi:hypothetical protein